ncbi:caspase family protein [Streptomyces mutabilis]|uniref:caspase family protein n=1 Tax=Streptomyces mutabilis TaxID=67332 RepID=UPI0022BA6756|nr:caspase family protein [Streptomyces mutabilis]MCZ9349312.1 caspase family protein [Streptomyces mutabilis]
MGPWNETPVLVTPTELLGQGGITVHAVQAKGDGALVFAPTILLWTPKRRALLIGTEHYDYGRFAPLPTTQADVWGLGQVLRHRKIGTFISIQTETDLTADDMRLAIGEFLTACDEDELALAVGLGARRETGQGRRRAPRRRPGHRLRPGGRDRC